MHDYGYVGTSYEEATDGGKRTLVRGYGDAGNCYAEVTNGRAGLAWPHEACMAARSDVGPISTSASACTAIAGAACTAARSGAAELMSCSESAVLSNKGRVRQPMLCEQFMRLMQNDHGMHDGRVHVDASARVHVSAYDNFQKCDFPQYSLVYLEFPI